MLRDAFAGWSDEQIMPFAKAVIPPGYNIVPPIERRDERELIPDEDGTHLEFTVFVMDLEEQ
jgi:hypothetical protein